MQVYAASIMFGYFVRRVDKRFQLESRLGLLPEQQEDPVARLERLFSQVPFVSHPASSSSLVGPPSTAERSLLQVMSCECSLTAQDQQGKLCLLALLYQAAGSAVH